jgi:hypothetical protein
MILPNPGKQAQRIAPQFERLQQAMDARRVALQNNTLAPPTRTSFGDRDYWFHSELNQGSGKKLKGSSGSVSLN